jgi:hypothetical protein
MRIDSLLCAMLVVSWLAAGAVWFFWKVGGTVRHDLASVASNGGAGIGQSVLSTT